MQLVAADPESIACIAGFAGLRHLGYLSITNRMLHTVLSSSWTAWTMVTQQAWGSYNSLESLRIAPRPMDALAETPTGFAKRMLHPWLHTPRYVDPQLPAVLPTQLTRAGLIQLDSENRLEVTAQITDAANSNFFLIGHSVVDHPLDTVVTYPLRAGPLTRAAVAELSANESCRWMQFLDRRYFIWRQPQQPRRLLQFDGFYSSCWRMNAGVVVVTFIEVVEFGEGVAALGFFGARTRKLLHVHFVHEECNATRDLFVACPGEMWVLERWRDPDSRLAYWGPRRRDGVSATVLV